MQFTSFKKLPLIIVLFLIVVSTLAGFVRLCLFALGAYGIYWAVSSFMKKINDSAKNSG